MVTQAGHVISYFDTEVGRYTPIVITIAQLVGTFISIPLIHRYEWKYITIVGGFILATCNSLLAILFVEYYENKWQLTMVLAMVVIIL